ncbi:MAG: universal stress protein [Deltaproteobacteria bacterium]|nr:universal stress protein [Deltaproteobacteria bacterium]
MFKRILVAIDGSSSSLHALRQAFPLARAEKGAIQVIAVAPPYTGELSLVGVREHVNDLIVAPYQKALDEALKISESYGVLIRTILEIGEPPETIVDTAEDLDCDLIVVGVRGSNPVKTVLMGSIAARVIGFSHIDVLAVPRGAEIDLNAILLAVDGSWSSERATSIAFELQKSYGLRLSALSVADIPSQLYGLDAKVAEQMLRQAREVLDPVRTKSEAQGIPVELLLREGDAAEVINQTAKQKSAGMIIIGSHGRTGLKRLLMGSVAERVIGHALCPVLVTRS